MNDESPEKKAKSRPHSNSTSSVLCCRPNRLPPTRFHGSALGYPLFLVLSRPQQAEVVPWSPTLSRLSATDVNWFRNIVSIGSWRVEDEDLRKPHRPRILLENRRHE